MTIDRRQLLQAGVAGLSFCSLSSSLRALTAALPPASNRRLLTLFLRGGNDGLNTVIPLGDPAYATLRPDIFYGAPGSGSARECLAMPNYGLVGLHPSLDELVPLLTAGRVAMMHRVGNFTGQRSHFTEMHLVETGRDDYSATHAGWLPQVAVPLAPTATLPLISVSDRLQRMYAASAADVPPVHIQKAYSSGAVRLLTVPFGDPATPPAERIPVAVRRAVSTATPTYPMVGQAAYLRTSTVGAIDALETLRASLPSFPHDGTSYPSLAGDPVPLNAAGQPRWSVSAYAEFFERLEEGVRYLRAGLANVVGLELGGWDTHDGQVLQQEVLLWVLGHALRFAHDDLAQGNDPFMILVVSEFGRTAADNGSGTDHGVGGVCWALGSNVRGGVYNCSDPAWPQAPNTPTGVVPWRSLALPPSIPEWANALEPATDFRVPLVELATGFFGLTPGAILALSGVGPQWDMILQSQTQTQFQMLGYVI